MLWLSVAVPGPGPRAMGALSKSFICPLLVPRDRCTQTFPLLSRCFWHMDNFHSIPKHFHRFFKMLLFRNRMELSSAELISPLPSIKLCLQATQHTAPALADRWPLGVPILRSSEDVDAMGFSLRTFTLQ